jgi:hypothetical protein
MDVEQTKQLLLELPEFRELLGLDALRTAARGGSAR